jgi:hypothetical protein
MSWHFSQALVAEFSAGRYSDGGRYAPLRSIPFAPDDSCSAKMKDIYHHSPYGMMFVPSEEKNGRDILTWFRAGFLVKLSAQQRTEKLQPEISGQKCERSSDKLSPDLSSPRTYPAEPLTGQRRIVIGWVTGPIQLPFPRRTWVLTTFGSDTGYLHTPTCAANFAAESMQKHPNCRVFVRVFGRPGPTNFEWLMGWPIGWTDSKLLGTDKFQSWQQRHLECSMNAVQGKTVCSHLNEWLSCDECRKLV